MDLILTQAIRTLVKLFRTGLIRRLKLIRIPAKLFRMGLIRLLKLIRIPAKLFRTGLIRLLKLIPTLRDMSQAHQAATSLTRQLPLPRVAMKL